MLKRNKAVAKPLKFTFIKLNQIIKGWINYFRIGSMKMFMERFGQWLRHKIRVIILKQWKKPRTIIENLSIINERYGCNFSEEDIYKVGNSRLGWYAKAKGNVVNYILSPKVLEKANKKKERPGLVNPLDYYLK